MRQPGAPGLNARKAALRAVNHVLINGGLLDFDAFQAGELSSADRAMARRIALAALRHVGRADCVLSKMMARNPPIRARNILRLALAEIFVCGTKPHAGVDMAVRLISSDRRHFRLKGFVNAVLRKSVGAEGRLVWKEAEPTRLPGWIAGPVADSDGLDALRRIESAHEADPPLDLTPKRASEAESMAETLGAELLPNGSLRLSQPGRVKYLHGFSSGAWWVQDFASSLAVRLLGNLHGRTVLDLCAAPGGKTLQCSASGGEITALDRSRKRLDILRANLMRTGLHAKTIHCDALDWESCEQFDAVIVDAPCSATGTIRRHPDLPCRKQNDGWAETMYRTQRRLLEKAFSHARPDGRILYCVCSLLPQEGEHVVRWAKGRFDAKAVKVNCAAIGACPSWQTPEGGLRTRPDYWPGRGGMDGFYAAALVRRAAARVRSGIQPLTSDT